MLKKGGVPQDQINKIQRAVLWVAVSSQAQAKEGDISLDEQERAMRAWCETHGAVVVDVLSVPGHSRSEEDILTLIDEYRRQGISAYDDLRAHWQKRDFDLLLLYDNSRLARSNPLYVWCATCVQSAGARIYRIVGGWMESGEFQVLLGSVEATAGIKRLVKMRHAKMDEYASRGLPTSSRHSDALLVIRDEKHRMVKMVPDPARAQEWQDLALIFCGGLDPATGEYIPPTPYHQLEQTMHQRFGYPKHYSNYYYQFLWRPSTWGHTARHMHDQRGLWAFDLSAPVPDGIKIWRNSHEPVISGQLAESIQDEMKRRHHEAAVIQGNARPAGAFAFTGLLICGTCGARLLASRKADRYHTYYRCRTNPPSRYRAGHCTNPVRIEHLTITRKIDHLLRQALAFADPELFFAARREGASTTDTVAAIADEIAALERRAKTALEKLSDTNLEALREVFSSELLSLNERLKIKKERLAGLTRAAAKDTTRKRGQALKRLHLEILWWLPEHEINQILHQVFGDIRFAVMPSGEVYWVERT